MELEDATVTDDGSAPVETVPEPQGSAPEGATPETVAPATDGSAPPEPAPVDAEPEPWVNLLKKHNGDKAAAAKDFWDTKTFASQAHRENETLKARLAELESQPRQPQAPPEPHPDLKAIDERINAFTEERKALDADIQAAASEYYKLTEGIAGARAVKAHEVQKADEFQRAEVEERWNRHIAQLEAAQRNALMNHNSLQRQKKGFDHELGRLNGEKRSVEQAIASQEARQREEAATLQKFQQEFPTTFDGYVSEAANELKVPHVPEVRKDLTDITGALAVRAYLLMGGIDHTKVDHRALTKKLTSDAWGVLDRLSRARLTTTPAPAPGRPGVPRNPARPATSVAPGKPLSAEDEIANDPTLKAARARLAAAGL